MMKKFLAALLLLSMALAGCGAEKQPEAAAAPAGPTRVAALKGPTAIGMVKMMDTYKGQPGIYTFDLYTGADEIVPLLVKGEADIALVPANVAATLYQKTEGQVRVIGVNTLSVLEFVTADTAVQSVAGLKGKKVYMTGKGTTPEYALRYVLEKNGLSMDDMQIDFKSEASEVVAALTQDASAVGLLPQPFATVATTQNDTLQIVMHLGDEWDKVAQDGSHLVTGVTVSRMGFEPMAMDAFLNDHAESAQFVKGHPDEAAPLVEESGIVKAPVAQKAIPNCGIVSLKGEEMKQALQGYLEALYEMSPEAVGGALPDDNFYAVDTLDFVNKK